MKLLDIQAAIGTAILLLSLPCDAKHSHQLSHLEAVGKRHNHKRLHASPRAEGIEDGSQLQKRNQCSFPSDDSLVAVTPGSQNAGWAMSPDQPCTPGSYCPIACKPGYVMAQWNPQATSYVYPLSMDGGLYCDSNGEVSKPFPNQPYCVSGTGAVSAQNTVDEVVSFCQTVLPGNEAMLIPTAVPADGSAQLAIPGPSYWCSTASHFYINSPGISTADACVWSDGSKPLGNWSPFVAGGNTDENGNTFFKIGWNPVYLSSSFANTLPTFGIKIECSGSGCNGLPCSIDPSVVGINGVTSADQANGAGGGNFCVVTIPSGETASIVIFSAGNSNAGSGSGGGSSSAAAASTAPTSTHTSAAPAKSTTQPQAQSSTSTTAAATTTTTSSKASHTISLLPSTTVNTTSSAPTADNSPHILFQNETSTTVSSYAASGTGGSTISLTSPSPIASATKKSGASETFASSSILGFVILFAVAGYLL